MKVIFELERNDSILENLHEIASKYDTFVKKQDEGEGHFIFVKSKLKIAEKFKENKCIIHVWGAKEEDIEFLKHFWGEPTNIIEQKPSPQAFINEISNIPDVENLTKQDIMDILGLEERDLNQYKRFIKIAGRRPNASFETKKAQNILERLD